MPAPGLNGAPPPPPLPSSVPASNGTHHGRHHHHHSQHHQHKAGHKDSHHSSVDKERERAERAKADRARQQQQQHKQHQTQQQQQHGNHPDANRLRRETPFLASIRFKNDLPEIPGDPKMLVNQVQSNRLAAFNLTTLELEPKRDLVLPPDLGIPITVLDVDRYAVPANSQPQLDPADAALLGGADDRLLPGSVLPKARAMRNTEVSWLMRTTYISNDTDAVRKPGYNEKTAKSMRQAAAEVEPEDESREAQIAAIEASFEAAQQPPVHHKNPALQPVEVLPVFPDFECWAYKYIMAHFDNDPTEEVEVLAKLPPGIRNKVASRCMLKGFKVDNQQQQQQQQGQGERFMALVVPEQIPSNLDPSAPGQDVDPSELEGDYIWSKEYAYDLIRREQEAEARQEYFIRFGDGVASYCDINARLELRKRAEMNESLFARPAKVIIKRREPTDAELEERHRKLRRLLGEEDDGMRDM
eukprot:CAMPEP_0202909366 /NCGR_PEP_ID=MMETSP1392-20130828/49130_1 /ASSEMBLY_ACC=CAM_ASM_000868 /TAXON_ID=225041 /ORGANISM="Chlamydomonas chlamydogama, Strain SAG 11-48b" /LENGTH=471 /DNA_ID=CAMNT_0049599097 /DNA_START=124 /DNA_END=1539 /DNA_ORIENTATION=-